MSPVVDETAGDLPVRDVGLMRGGLMPTVPDTLHDVKPLKKHLMKIKDPQRLFRYPREHLEDLCLRLQEENSVLKQNSRTQEHRLRRMSNRLMRLRQSSSGSSPFKERDVEDTVQELEARVAMLESQREVLQNKLSLAKQHILDLGTRTPYRCAKGKNLEGEGGGVRRAAQTAPPRYGLTLDETRTECERLRSCMTEQLRMTELELTAQALRDSLREREKEMEGTVRELRRQQADRHRTTIRENVDLIRLQKQLSEKSAALRVAQEKLNNLQEAYENQLEESQRSLREAQGALLEKVEELSEHLKQERQKALALEEQLTSATLSLQTIDKLQERVSDLEGERDLIKNNYDTLVTSTLSTQTNGDAQAHRPKEVEQKREERAESTCSLDVQRLEQMLLHEREERTRLEVEKERLSEEKEALDEERKREKESSALMREKQEHLEQEIVRYKEKVSAQEDRLNSVTKEFDMSVEELSETLLQIKAFRMQKESREALMFLVPDGNPQENPELVNIQATHAETVLELQKTRNLLLLEHQISRDLQEEINAINERVEREQEENRRRMEEKDKLLSRRALQINTLQTQLKELAYSPRNYKRTIPVQYTWPAGDQEVAPPIEDDLVFSQLKPGESLLEIHLKAATFTPAGLRIMSDLHPGTDIVTFCTYCLLDFEMHSTPLVSGSQPNYGFTSRYALTARDLGRLGGQGSRMRVELHQALGGVRFVTQGSGHMSLMGAMETRGERISGGISIIGNEGEIVAVVDFWVRLFPPTEPVNISADFGFERRTFTKMTPAQIPLGWQDCTQEQQQLHDFGGGIPNELVVMLERCVGLSARWPGLLPDAYLTYRLYDLPPHVSQIVQCSSDPVLNDLTIYPLAVTSDLLLYLRCSCLWVYVFDDSDEQTPPAYLAKTPIPLRALATGREIRGDYVLRDPAGGPRGTVRVTLKWKYPFKPPEDPRLPRQRREMADEGRARKSTMSENRRREEATRPVAKPRAKTQRLEPRQTQENVEQKEKNTLPLKHRIPLETRTEQITAVKPRKRSSKRSSERCLSTPHLTPEPRLSISSHKPSATAPLKRSSATDVDIQDLTSLDQASLVGEERKGDRSESDDSEAPESSESTQSDIIVVPPKRKIRKGDKLRVEILSLTFEQSSNVALDKSVQRVYVEYRLLGVPMETTETPMSLRKPAEGEEIHYNFTRVIYVDGSQSAPLRQYLYTMLEGTDPNRGRLKFTVVSEPMDDNEECVDVGHAFLDLQELLLTGNDLVEQQIDIVSVDEDQEVIGNLKVSLEAAKALNGIYQEFRGRDGSETGGSSADEEEEEQQEQEKKQDQIQLLDYDDDGSVFD